MYTINYELLDDLNTQYGITQWDVARAWNVSQSAISQAFKNDFTLRQWMLLSQLTKFPMGCFVVSTEDVVRQTPQSIVWTEPTFQFARLYYDIQTAVKLGAERTFKFKRRIPKLMKENSAECLDKISVNNFLQMVAVTGDYMGRYISDVHGTYPYENTVGFKLVPARKYEEMREEIILLQEVKENMEAALQHRISESEDELSSAQKELKMSNKALEDVKERHKCTQSSLKRSVVSGINKNDRLTAFIKEIRKNACDLLMSHDITMEAHEQISCILTKYFEK